jgi:glycerophosphoryl diester phosphodiesterase
LHDATLDRTTTGKGNLKDYTWDELKKLRLKDLNGNVTPYQIPLLEDAIKWSKGKTVLVLDDKDVPYRMVKNLVTKHNAFPNILMTVRNAEIARQFYKLDKRFMFEAYVFDMQDISEFESAGIPWSHVMAYIGPLDTPENTIIYEELNERGVKGMVSGARYLDKDFLNGNKKTYHNIFNHGADIIESDLPVQAAIQISELTNKKGGVCKYFGKMEIPLNQIKYLP